ncbi:helix-turn-helix domain-containing protein [Arthrobacter pityocampae]|uniref:helix-turn-helix domain-containing protein n=1 Tax=Arthrobacter pityocampae TaxID=547334 RepID=UPI003736BAF5
MPRREPPLTVKEAALALNQSEKAIRYLCRAGAFPNAYKKGSGGVSAAYRIPVADLDRYEKTQARAHAA